MSHALHSTEGQDAAVTTTALHRIRGPYPIAAGVAAYEKHLKLHPRRQSFAGRAGQVHDVPATGTGGRP